MLVKPKYPSLSGLDTLPIKRWRFHVNFRWKQNISHSMLSLDELTPQLYSFGCEMQNSSTAKLVMNSKRQRSYYSEPQSRWSQWMWRNLLCCIQEGLVCEWKQGDRLCSSMQGWSGRWATLQCQLGAKNNKWTAGLWCKYHCVTHITDV